jgi:hypothetical protein
MTFQSQLAHTMADQVVPVAIPRLPSSRAWPRSAPASPQPESTLKIEDFSLSELRKKVRQNRVSFPSQVPTFEKHDRPDVQRKAVQLYFLFGWSCNRIAQRHGLLRQRVQQILSTWKRRAIQMGYIQEIPLAPKRPS